jgi:hypothetical protein
MAQREFAMVGWWRSRRAPGRLGIRSGPARVARSHLARGPAGVVRQESHTRSSGWQQPGTAMAARCRSLPVGGEAP